MPAPEFESWKFYYMIEPWGWHDMECRTGAILAMLNNVNVGKKKDLKKESYYMRDMTKLIMKAYENVEGEELLHEKLLEVNIDERKKMIARAFGKDVKIDNSGNYNSGNYSG